MTLRERCPTCSSTNITGRNWDTADGDETQDRYCYDCGHGESRLRSAGGVDWYTTEPVQSPHRSHTATGLERTLLDEIYAVPDDDGPRSIYADWLIEQGDPRGTFIALQLARAARRDPVVSSQEQNLLDAHWSAWIGEPSAYFGLECVAYERGFWSSCELSIDTLPELALEHRAWSTVHRLVVSLSNEPHLPKLLDATHRSLRSIRVPSRAAFRLVASSQLPIEKLELAFDVSRDPPSLGPLSELAALRTLVIHCHPEFAERWLERMNETRIPNLVLAFRPYVDDLGHLLKRAQDTSIARLALETPEGLVLHVVRDSDGTIAVRSIELRPALAVPRQQLVLALHYIVGIKAFVDPGVKVTMPEITAELARYADDMGLRLVRHATSFAAQPR